VTAAVRFRTARPADVPAIHRLIADNIEVGHLLPRSREDIALHANRFVVAKVDDVVVGCAELAPLSAGVAEVRSLVVTEAMRGRKIGSRLVRKVIAEATEAGFSSVCAFTHEPAHFVRLGFTIVPHIWVPEKIAKDCTSCSLFRRCGQYAVTFALRAGVTIQPERPAALIAGVRGPGSRHVRLRPVAAEPAAAEAVPA
jgi:amino-acid N-acetyltransferase